MKLHIGFDSKRLFHNNTGLGNYSRTLLHNLKKYFPDFEYTLFSPTVKENITAAQDLNTFSNKSIFPNWLWRSYFIKNAIQQSNIQLYHGLSNELPKISSEIKRIVTVHDLIFEKLPSTYSWINRFIYRYKFKKACKKADLVIAISESTKADIGSIYKIKPNKIKTLYQACLPDFYKPIYSTQSISHYALPNKYFLFVGSIIPRKNIEIIIEAMSYFSPKDLIPLVVIGNGDKHKQTLIEKAKKLNLEKNIKWIHNLKEVEELKQVYQKAEALIYPSLYEGFGLPIVEGMLCKTPVIAANTSSLKEAGGSAAIYIDPFDAKALFKQMKSIYIDPTIKAAMIKKGHEHAHKQFDPKKLSKELIEIYKSIL